MEELAAIRAKAELGDAEAQCSVGLLYEQGKGVEQVYREALYWYRLAARQGHKTAMLRLGVMTREGRGLMQDHVLAQMWFDLAEMKTGDADDLATERSKLSEILTNAQKAQTQKLVDEYVARKYWASDRMPL